MDASNRTVERTPAGWIVARCKSSACRARIIFAHPAGSPPETPTVPYNAEPNSMGTTLLDGFGPTPVATYIHRADRGEYDGRLYVNHFATCVTAQAFRRRRGATTRGW